MSALCKSGCLGCEHCDPTGERRERNDRNTSYFIGVHQSVDVLVRERDNAIAYAAQVEAHLRAVEEERDQVQRKYDDAMEVLTRWDKVDAAVAIAEAQAEARRLLEELRSILRFHSAEFDARPDVIAARAALTPPHAGPAEKPHIHASGGDCECHYRKPHAGPGGA